ncbi:MAG: hypothetical protein QXQ24_08365 [Nitrososphaeria archaeon]
MKRYETIDWLNGSKLIDYELPVIEYDESITDKSHFIPMAESVKRLSVGPMSADTIAMMYDYPDGKDNGMNVPIGRKKGVDIAEVSNEIRLSQNKIKQQLKEGKERADIAKSVDNAMAGVIQNSNSSSGNNSGT